MASIVVTYGVDAEISSNAGVPAWSPSFAEGVPPIGVIFNFYHVLGVSSNSRFIGRMKAEDGDWKLALPAPTQGELDTIVPTQITEESPVVNKTVLQILDELEEA